MMDCFDLPSFHDGSGSAAPAIAKLPNTKLKPSMKTVKILLENVMYFSLESY
jgi:hypothetical protein